MKVLFCLLSLLFVNVSYALEYRIDPDGINQAQLHNFQLHLEKLNNILPQSFKKIEKVKIRFKRFEKSKRSEHMADYNSLLNRMTINSVIIPSSGDSQVLLRTLIHELTHAYEDQVKKLHTDPMFWFQSGWHKRGAVFYTLKRRNFMESRSPDPYEYAHPRETLAVNMEYFLTDHTYQCRRPMLFNYLSDAVEHTLPWIECTETPEVPIVMGNDLLWTQLYDKRLYEVHYLMASEGEAIMSRFGHSMLRLVFCAPERKTVGKECLRDLEHHLVISYRANITDLVLSYWGGLVGNYPSQLFLMTMSEVIHEYNQIEFRDLISIPLKLSYQQKERVIPLLLTEMWSYRGKYRFITQNCATETMDFLKMLMHNYKLLQQKVTTPRGVYRKLKKQNLVDDSEVFGENAKHYGYLFESKRKQYLKIFEKIKNYFSYEKFEDFLLDSTPAQRNKEFETMQLMGVSMSIAASMYVMEKQIENMKSKKFFDKATRKILMGSNVPEVLREYVEQRVLPKDISHIQDSLGYGIPLYDEFELIKEILARPKDSDAIKLMQQWLQENLKDDLDEIDAIKENLVRYKKYLVSH